MIEIQKTELDNSTKKEIREYIDKLIYATYPNGVLWSERASVLDTLLTSNVIMDLNNIIVNRYKVFDGNIVSLLSKEDYIEISMQ